jgi:hypothetical protein
MAEKEEKDKKLSVTDAMKESHETIMKTVTQVAEHHSKAAIKFWETLGVDDLEKQWLKMYKDLNKIWTSGQ